MIRARSVDPEFAPKPIPRTIAKAPTDREAAAVVSSRGGRRRAQSAWRKINGLFTEGRVERLAVCNGSYG